jgi:beta-glucosidase
LVTDTHLGNVVWPARAWGEENLIEAERVQKIIDAGVDLVDKPENADIAILRLNTPWVSVETDIPMAKMFHHGDLDFKGTQKDSILQLLNVVPTIVDIYLDRPAVIPEINAKAKGSLADFGASDAAVLDVIFGKYKPGGHLPIELPSSMDAVRNQKTDMPYDSKDPLYKFGFGLSY